MSTMPASGELARSAPNISNSIKSQLSRWLLIGSAIAALVAIVVYPLLYLLKFSLTAEDGSFTLNTFATVFSEPGMLQATLNSLWLVAIVVVASTLLGTLLAWLVARTDIPFKGLITTAAGISFVIPTFITVIAWIFLAAPNSGAINQWLVSTFGLSQAPFNIISFAGLALIETVHLYPLTFFSVLAALKNVDVSHEQAARVLGAGRFTTLRTITLPLVLPAILASSILVMLDTLSSFGAPSVIGTMANFSVLTTKLYDLLTFPPRLNLAAAVAVPIVLYTLICLWVQRRLISGDDYRSISGKSTSEHLIPLTFWRLPLAAVVLTIIFITAILPLGGLLLLSTIKVLGMPIDSANLGINHYLSLLDQSFGTLDAIYNSLWLSLACASLCICLAIACAWIVERTRLPGRATITALIMISYGFPSIAFGVGIMLGYIDLFYGTLTLLLIAYIAKQLPVAFVLIRTALKQISVDLEEAARIVGASWLRAIWDITLPLLKVSLVIGWVMVFSLSIRELSMSVLLAQADTQVMSTVILQYIADGNIEVAAALSAIIVAICLLIMTLVYWLSRHKPQLPH